MGTWSDPDAFQMSALHEALLFAYPTQADFETFLTFSLAQSFAQLAPAHVGYRNALAEVLILARGGGWLDALVHRARADKPHSPKLLLLDRNVELTRAEVPPSVGRALEDIVRRDGGYQDLLPWVEKMEALAHRTCRIECPVNSACGTGWLVGPDLVLTNWHVVSAALPGGARKASEYVCRFDYAVADGATRPGRAVAFAGEWCVDKSPPSTAELGTGRDGPTGDTLDHALVRLAERVGQQPSPTGKARGWVEARNDAPLPADREIVFVVQHPDGLPVKLAPGDVKGSSADKLRIFHTANTSKGSSGSLVVNARVEAIALHHAGDALYSEGIGAPEKNQAVPIGLVFRRLRTNGCLP